MKLSTDEVYLYDMMPELVGKEGIVDKVSVTQGIAGYALNNIPEKYAWYHEDQLILVE